MKILPRATVLRCYPHKECILFNLDQAMYFQGLEVIEQDRLEFLIKCHRALASSEYEEAVKLAQKAGYLCMSQAIQIHYLEE